VKPPPLVASWTTPKDGDTVSGHLMEHAHNCIVSASSKLRIDHVSFYRDGTLLNTQRDAPYSCVWDTTKAAEGTSHTLKAVAHDTLGHSASASVSVTVHNADTTAPQTTIIGGPSGTIGTSDVSFSFRSSEARSSFECRLDAASWAPCSSPTAYGELTDGAHSFEVRATDAAANTDATPDSRSFTVDSTPSDTTPPETTITAGPSGTITTDSASFSFSSSEAGSNIPMQPRRRIVDRLLEPQGLYQPP
jgi:hypothetical protein